MTVETFPWFDITVLRPCSGVDGAVPCRVGEPRHPQVCAPPRGPEQGALPMPTLPTSHGAQEGGGARRPQPRCHSWTSLGELGAGGKAGTAVMGCSVPRVRNRALTNRPIDQADSKCKRQGRQRGGRQRPEELHWLGVNSSLHSIRHEVAHGEHLWKPALGTSVGVGRVLASELRSPLHSPPRPPQEAHSRPTPRKPRRPFPARHHLQWKEGGHRLPEPELRSHPLGPAGRAALRAPRGTGRQLVDALGYTLVPAGAGPASPG